MVMAELHKKHCVPCEGGVLPLTIPQAQNLLAELNHWTLAPNSRSISKTLNFKDFESTMKVVNSIAALAEEEGHHPDLHISYAKLRIELTTHAIGGLSQNDFILAAKIDRLTN